MVATVTKQSPAPRPRGGEWISLDESAGRPVDRPWQKWECIIPPVIWTRIATLAWIPRDAFAEWTAANWRVHKDGSRVRNGSVKLRLFRSKTAIQLQLWRVENQNT